MKKWVAWILIPFLLLSLTGAGADPSLSVQDSAVRTGSWADTYAEILREREGSIRAYPEYVLSVTSLSECRPVDLRDLTGDGIPELLFLELFPDEEYGFQLGRLWIYTSDGEQTRCALTLQPEIDDLLYSRLYLAENGALTLHFSDTERGWTVRLLPGKDGRYAPETILTEEADFSGEGPDRYYRNGKQISAKEFQKQRDQLQSSQGAAIGSLMVDDGGTGLALTPEEALAALAAGELSGTTEPGAAASAKDRLPELTFSPAVFEKGQKFAVYSAPSAKAHRSANGKAAITSGSEIFAAGLVDDWILIRYELDSGVTRVGYVDSRKIQGSWQAGSGLTLDAVPMKLTAAAVLTDDPANQKSTIGRLKKGAQVTALARYQGWVYVEAKVAGKTARGFLPPASLE